MAPRKKAEPKLPPKPRAKPGPKPKPKPVAKPKPKPKPKPPPKKSRSKFPRRQLSPDPPTPAKRRKLSAEETPEWDRGLTSQSQRNRSVFKISRARLHDESINDESIDMLLQDLDPSSLSMATFGVSISEPIRATMGMKGKSIVRPVKMGEGVAKISSWGRIDPEKQYKAMMEHMKGPDRVIIPNTPERSPFLRISLEIRERVYAYVLNYSGPILVKQDWRTIETNRNPKQHIRRVCKQLYNEATTWLFKQTVIQAIFRRNTRAFTFYDEPVAIPEHFISYYKDVVMDFNNECWSYDWYDKATESLKVLVAAKPALRSLTLVVAPKRVGMSTTALGIEPNPITFADLVWYDGAFMQTLRVLAPKAFKIVVRKGPTKKLTVEVDLKYLHASSIQELSFMNPETWRLLSREDEALQQELRGLMDTFQEIFEDDGAVVQQGRCTTNEPEVEGVVPSPVKKILETKEDRGALVINPTGDNAGEKSDDEDDGEEERDDDWANADGLVGDGRDDDLVEVDSLTEDIEEHESTTRTPTDYERFFDDDPEAICSGFGAESDGSEENDFDIMNADSMLRSYGDRGEDEYSPNGYGRFTAGFMEGHDESCSGEGERSDAADQFEEVEDLGEEMSEDD